jgi:tetratricopeptide (TPR) repeat protein
VRICALVLGTLLFNSESAMAIDLAPLWDFNRPDVSEQRFRKALESATGDDELILQTQIARTWGLRKDFDAARQILRQMERRVETAGAEARARYELEMGRTFASAAHLPEALTPENTARARRSFEAALSIARSGQLDGLAIDAIHMFAFVDTAPVDQQKWALAALEIVEASSQPAAKRWEASVRNNLGYALHQLGRYDEALAQFQQAVVIRERGENTQAKRIANWMVAWTLRSMKRVEEALAIQLRLEKENDADGQPDPEVFDELQALYQAKGDAVRAQHYANRKQAVLKQ